MQGVTGMDDFLTREHSSENTMPRTVQGKDINRRVVYGAFEMGVGKEGIAKLCELLDMPFSMSADTWYSHEQKLNLSHDKVTQNFTEQGCLWVEIPKKREREGIQEE